MITKGQDAVHFEGKNVQEKCDAWCCLDMFDYQDGGVTVKNPSLLPKASLLD